MARACQDWMAWVCGRAVGGTAAHSRSQGAELST